ncbi:MAG: LamG-like jellyroll fold domain-containing protein [Planctomycetota bacterium]
MGLVSDFDGLHRHFYVDGVEVARDSVAVGGVGSNGELHVGAGPAREAGTFWSGLIDDIRIYDEVLSAEEVADLAR